MKCSACKFDIDDVAFFCPQCGTRINREAQIAVPVQRRFSHDVSEFWPEWEITEQIMTDVAEVVYKLNSSTAMANGFWKSMPDASGFFLISSYFAFSASGTAWSACIKTPVIKGLFRRLDLVSNWAVLSLNTIADSAGIELR